VLYGTPASVTLTATDAAGNPADYNASFEDILPAGVGYVPGSSTLAGNGTTSPISNPTVLDNEPATGQTTLIWTNVADVQPAASAVVSFKLQAETDSGVLSGANPVLPGSSYTDASSVYSNTNPRFVPQFNSTTGAPVTGSNSYTDTASTSGTSAIVPLSVSKAEPSPEHELPRGVHDHQVVYTITVTNNDVHATDAVAVLHRRRRIPGVRLAGRRVPALCLGVSHPDVGQHRGQPGHAAGNPVRCLHTGRVVLEQSGRFRLRDGPVRGRRTTARQHDDLLRHQRHPDCRE
jgi:uncharacterized repeat protein (TIGR01451 family)